MWNLKQKTQTSQLKEERHSSSNATIPGCTGATSPVFFTSCEVSCNQYRQSYSFMHPNCLYMYRRPLVCQASRHGAEMESWKECGPQAMLPCRAENLTQVSMVQWLWTCEGILYCRAKPVPKRTSEKKKKKSSVSQLLKSRILDMVLSSTHSDKAIYWQLPCEIKA